MRFPAGKKELEQGGAQTFPGKGHTQDEEMRQLQRENQRLQETVAILKKAVDWASPISSPTAPRKIPPADRQFIQEHRSSYSLQRLCDVLEVSVSGYYAWKKRPESKRQKENNRLVAQIKIVYEQSQQTYGIPRVYVDLKKQGITCSQNRVARLMKSHQIAAERKRKFILTTDSKHNLPVADNDRSGGPP